MNNRNIEKSLAEAIDQAPTLEFESLVNAPYIKLKEHDFITRQSEKQTTNHRKQWSVAFMFCFAVLIIFSGWFMQYRVPDSIITLDVNPSIEIVTNRQDRVLSVKALNEDAQKIMEGLNIKHGELGSTVDILIASMIQQGFLDVDKNVIMISVENNKIQKADALALSLEQLLKDSPSWQNITPKILRQAFTKDRESTALAKQYHVSVGKLKLIQKILSADSTFSMDTLASKSMKELLELSNKSTISPQSGEDKNLNEESDFDEYENEKDNTGSNNEKSENEDRFKEGKHESSGSEDVDNQNDDSQSEDGDDQNDDSQSEDGDNLNDDSQSENSDSEDEDAPKTETYKNMDKSSTEDTEDNNDNDAKENEEDSNNESSQNDNSTTDNDSSNSDDEVGSDEPISDTEVNQIDPLLEQEVTNSDHQDSDFDNEDTD